MNVKTIGRRAHWILLTLLLGFGAAGIPVAQAKPHATIVVNTASDFSPGNCNTTCTLRDAVGVASNGDTINFAGDYTINLSGQLSFSKNLTIDGAGHNIIINSQITGSLFYVNSAITLNLNALTVANGNAGFSYGGAIYNNGGTVNITNSFFSGNHADNSLGGAIYNNGTSNITNSTFSGNHADSSMFGGAGGAIYNAVGTVNVTNSTFSGNYAKTGGDIFNLGTVTLKNTILANSASGGNCYNTGTIADGGNNLDDSTTCGLSATTSLTNTNPQLGALTGSPAYFLLNANSPAIDAGNNATCAATPVNGLDQRGQARNDLQCDMGSYEMQMTDRNNTTFTPGTTMRTFGPLRMGIQVTSGDTGAVTVTKVTNWTPSQPASAIKAWWELAPTNTIGFTANVKLCYTDLAELNGLDPANLHLWRYSGNWSDMGRSQPDSSGNCVQANGITGFSRWTLATSNPGSAPTAVTLSSFNAHARSFDLGAEFEKILRQWIR